MPGGKRPMIVPVSAHKRDIASVAHGVIDDAVGQACAATPHTLM
jgi:hypothetical protein